MAEPPADLRHRPFSISAAFGRAAQWTAHQCGRASTFVLACAGIMVWAVTGPAFGYSDTWQLVINTGTTIVTFLMVFLIQNTQNRDMAVLHLKLDELIRASQSARNKLLALEDMTEEELERLKGSFAKLAMAPDGAGPRESADDLQAAGEAIEQPKQKVTAAGDRT
jgi:low affinity Fe/Cu permease